MGGRDDEMPGLDRRNRRGHAGACGKCRRAVLSGPHHRNGRALHAGLVGRHPGPHPGRQHGRPTRPALRGAEQGRRQRHPRHRRSRARQARRLHADARRRLLGDGAAADRAADRLHRRIVRADLPDLQERPGHRGAAEQLQDRGRPDRRRQSQDRRPELRQPGPRHHPAPVDGRAVADQQDRVQPRPVQGTGRGDPDGARRADRIFRWCR